MDVFKDNPEPCPTENEPANPQESRQTLELIAACNFHSEQGKSKKKSGENTLIRQSEALPDEPLAQRFCALFPHPWDFIYAPSPNTGKAQWKTQTGFPLKPRNLWAMWESRTQLVGVRFGKNTSYGLIDIDRGSQYHPENNPQAFENILSALENIGLNRFVIIFSSDSKGLHVYFPLLEAVGSYGLAVAVTNALELQGFKVKAGQLELFPNRKSYVENGFSLYSAHRLPLQQGSFLLSRGLEVLGNSLEQFLNACDFAALGQDSELLQDKIAQALSCAKRNFNSGKRSVKGEKFLNDLETRIDPGWTGRGQTNALLLDIARQGRIFECLEGEKLVEYIYQKAISLPGYQDYCDHQRSIKLRARHWAKCVQKKNYPYGSQGKKERPIKVNLNDEKHNHACDRIRQVVTALEPLPEGIDARAKLITAQARCSRQTLYKHLELWHPSKLVIATSNNDGSVDSPKNSTNCSECQSSQDINDKHTYNDIRHVCCQTCEQQFTETSPKKLVSDLSQTFVEQPSYKDYFTKVNMQSSLFNQWLQTNISPQYFSVLTPTKANPETA